MSNVDERLEWARDHLTRLRSMVEAHSADARRHAPASETITARGVTSTWAVIDLPAPPALGLTAGDAIHNLRASLDNLVWEVAPESARQRVARRLAFPAGRDPASFANFERDVMQDFSTAQRDAIRACQPFVPPAQGGLPDDGGRLLGLLDALWNGDKHRVPTVTVAYAGGELPAQQFQGSVAALGRIVGLEVWFVPEGVNDHATIDQLDKMHDLITSEVVPRLREAPRWAPTRNAVQLGRLTGVPRVGSQVAATGRVRAVVTGRLSLVVPDLMMFPCHLGCSQCYGAPVQAVLNPGERAGADRPCSPGRFRRHRRRRHRRRGPAPAPARLTTSAGPTGAASRTSPGSRRRPAGDADTAPGKKCSTAGWPTQVDDDTPEERPPRVHRGRSTLRKGGRFGRLRRDSMNWRERAIRKGSLSDGRGERGLPMLIAPMQFPDPRWESDDLPVLVSIYEFERDRQQRAAVGIADLATRLGRPVGDVAKSVHYLVLGGYVTAHDVTSMGSPHREYLIEGVTSHGLRACRVWPSPNADLTEAVLRAVERQDPGMASRLRELAKTAGVETLKVLVETAVKYGSGTLLGH